MDASASSNEHARRLRDAVQAKYREVAGNPNGHFRYPVGRESAVRLGYREDWLAAAPEPVLDRFVGVGNPFSVRRPAPGERVLDAGCGCGLDVFVASLLVGAGGRAVGLDLSEDMLDWARRFAEEWTAGPVSFERGAIEALPFEDASFDQVISNGALNLVPDKDAAFAEILRVLAPGGVFAAADLVAVGTIPEETLRDTDAWST